MDRGLINSPVEILAKLKKNLEKFTMWHFLRRILWEIQWCFLPNFVSWAKEVLSKNTDVAILCKIKFVTDSVLSVGVLKLTITTINCCVGCLHETGGKSNICLV